MSWIDEIKDRSVVEVADQLGYKPRRHASSSSANCPACGAEKRHTQSGDRRGAVGMPHAKPGAWRCFQCDAGGDALNFASYHIGGAVFRDLTSQRKDEVKAFFGFAEDYRVLPAPPRAQPARLPVEHENAFKKYPYHGEVDEFWNACGALWDDAEAIDYLRWRNIGNIAALVDHDCARTLPSGAACPEWAHFGPRPWSQTGHRLIVPLYDSMGRMRSFVARSVEHEPTKKSVGAKGRERAGLVMAGTFGREMLSTGAQAHWHRLVRLRIAVYEGEIDFLRAVSHNEDCELSEDWQLSGYKCVFGIFSGSFQRDVAGRVPSGTTVAIATDDDEQGDKYEAEIRERVGDRCDFERVRVPSDKPEAAQ